MDNMLPNTFEQESIDCLLSPILEPSGIWQDYNPVHLHWIRLCVLVDKGYIPKELRPNEPDTADYTDLESPRSAMWS